MEREAYTMWFMDVGMRQHSLYPTTITRAFCWVGERGKEEKSEGNDGRAIGNLIKAAHRIGITGYPSHCVHTVAGHCDAIDATPLYTNGAMCVEAITHKDRVIYGSLRSDLPKDHPAAQHPWTPWTAPVPGNERYQFPT